MLIIGYFVSLGLRRKHYHFKWSLFSEFQTIEFPVTGAALLGASAKEKWDQLCVVFGHQCDIGSNVTIQTRDIHIAFGGNLGHGHCHRPLLMCGPMLDVTLNGSTGWAFTLISSGFRAC